jgi:hypothetical protein
MPGELIWHFGPIARCPLGALPGLTRLLIESPVCRLLEDLFDYRRAARIPGVAE